MDIDLLKTFLEVNRTRHFGRAAENLYLSQSAISARIRQLEESVGTALFTRDRNDIRLTTIGRKFLPHAESIVTAWRRAQQEVALDPAIEQSLVIGGSASLWDIILQEWLYKIHGTMTDIAVTAEVASPNELLRRLLDGTMDLALTFEGPQINRLKVTEIARVPLILVSSEKAMNTRDALHKNYVLVDWGTSFLTEHARKFRDYPPPRMRLGLGRMAQEFLLTVGGSAYLAEPMVTGHLKRKSLFQVGDAPEFERVAFAVYPDEAANKAAVEQAISLLP